MNGLKMIVEEGKGELEKSEGGGEGDKRED